MSLTFAHGTLNILLGPTLSGKTSLMRLMAGLDEPTDGSVFFDGKDVTGVPVRAALGRDGLPAVHQLPEPDASTRTSPRRSASPARKQAELDRRVRETAALMKLTPLLAAQAAGAFRRPAAAHRAGARHRQGRRPRAARRAARQSRLQAARGTARGAAAHLLRHRRDLRLRHDRAGRGAAARRLDRDARAGPRHAVRPDASRSIGGRTAWRRRASSPIRRSTRSTVKKSGRGARARPPAI